MRQRSCGTVTAGIRLPGRAHSSHDVLLFDAVVLAELDRLADAVPLDATSWHVLPRLNRMILDGQENEPGRRRDALTATIRQIA